jgi:hypothetical protein
MQLSIPQLTTIGQFDWHLRMVIRLSSTGCCKMRVSIQQLTTMMQSDWQLTWVVDRLLQDARVDPASLHRPRSGFPAYQFPVTTLSNVMLPRLSASLSLPFPASSCISSWQPRLRQYRHEQIEFLEWLIASWLAHGNTGGLSREIVEDIVSEYLLWGGLRLHQFVALDLAYNRPPPPLVDPTISDEEHDSEDDDDEGDTTPAAAAAAAAAAVAVATSATRSGSIFNSTRSDSYSSSSVSGDRKRKKDSET